MTDFRQMHSPTAPPPAPAVAPAEPFGMLDLEEPPDVYGIDEVTVLARDPYTLFVYWEVTGAGRAAARAALDGEDGSLILRLVAAGGTEEPAQVDHPLDWDYGRRYLGAPRSGAWVTAAVGLVAAGGRFAPIAHAGRIKVPWADPGPEGPTEWMEVAPARSRGAEREPPSIVQRGPAQRVRGAGREPRWNQGAWQSPATRVAAPTSPAGPPSWEDMPSSPWRWHRDKGRENP
jgi:uncharacterized protein DUF4912